MIINKEIPVLIVDDYKTMLRILRGLLETIGFKNIDEATDGSMAMDMFADKKYGLVISELVMDPTSGLDFLKSIRTGNFNKDAPFIMVTKENKSDNVLAAKDAGVSSYILKPFNAETLQEKIEMALSGHVKTS